MAERDIPVATRRKVCNFLRNTCKEKLEAYGKYWNTLRPTNDRGYYDIWTFAFMSIHTTWKANVKGFLAVKDLPVDCKFNDLYDAIVASGVGLHHIRSKGLWEFRNKFWNDPKKWYSDGDMVGLRNMAAKTLFGIGYAKTSFAFEMAYPSECEVVCLDTHILKLYGFTKGSPGLQDYAIMEGHWLNSCKRYDIPSALARHIYWDRLQNQNDTRYWSYVFEKGE
jgi:hypothetical protein